MRVHQGIRTLLLAVCFSLLVGCNSFVISEKDMNAEVEKQLAQQSTHQVNLQVEGNSLNLDLFVTSALIQFTARDGGLVLVDLTSNMTGTLAAFGQVLSLTTKVNPSFESGVRIEEDRLYLVAPKILKIDVEGTSFSDIMLRSALGGLHGEFEKMLVTYFDEHPVYVLNNSSLEKTAASLVKNITIKDGSLELSLF